ncbi:hypothetical protein BSZ21_21950 [Bradyrhizobium canariense]|uniref:hypothetical protein n=1 Tax=Bradyrhizobium canariense TaxID=255045 RepID=UPI000A19104E|nr:hypothetical protein [Bradyrhizobium canariense]OSI65183.1 hypothetical protein BSZ21_21950 [Bradyrhizobium canariense]
MAARSGPDWRSALVESYADIFHPPGDPLAARGWPAVGDGWEDLLKRACRRMRAAVGDDGGPFRLTTIKEKFGSLRIQWEGSLPPAAAARVEEAVDLAEARSATTCDVCGGAGVLRGGGWMAVRCDDHAEGRTALAVEQGFENLHVERRVVRGRTFASYRFYDRAADRFVGVRNAVSIPCPNRTRKDAT